MVKYELDVRSAPVVHYLDIYEEGARSPDDQTAVIVSICEQIVVSQP